MANIRLQKDLVYAPFMGENRMPSVGLNPLGIRTASEQLFTTLLPGLNVVTLRIRYYSFYCWILKRFYETREEQISNHLWVDLREYVRLSEFLMACIHAVSSNSSGVPGITEAGNVNAKGEDLFDLRASALPEGKTSGGYWKGSMGALGTYYLASMQEIGLALPLEKDDRLYNITKRPQDFICGEDLADAFAESVGAENAIMFENCVAKGLATRSELEILAKTFQTHTMPDNAERALLIQMLQQKDKPRSLTELYLRKDTLRLFLKYIRDNETTKFSELEFARYIYGLYHDGKESSTAAAGWYAYYLNDSRQYEALNIFCDILDRLLDSNASGGWEKIDEFASDIADEVCPEFTDKNLTLRELMETWDEVPVPESTIGHAFYVMFDDYANNRSYKDCQKLIKMFFRDVRRDAMEQFDDIEEMLDMNLRDYIQRYIVENIIYRHYTEATRKFSQNGVPTQKLTIENGLVRGLAGFGTSHSSPRIDTLRNFATDLGLISENKITPDGIILLNQLEND